MIKEHQSLWCFLVADTCSHLFLISEDKMQAKLGQATCAENMWVSGLLLQECFGGIIVHKNKCS